MNEILDFYAFPDKPNRLGFCFNDLFKWSDNKLEHKHDYIQWFFPLVDKSVAQPDSPVLTLEELCFFSEMGRTRKMQKKAFNRMMRFFQIRFGFIRDYYLTDLPETPHWIEPHARVNHNYLRITRIIKSLKLFKNDKLARNLLDTLARNQFEMLRKAVKSDEAVIFPPSVLGYWREAIKVDPAAEIYKMLAYTSEGIDNTDYEQAVEKDLAKGST